MSKRGFVDRRGVLERRNVDLSTGAVYPKAETSEKRHPSQTDPQTYSLIYI